MHKKYVSDIIIYYVLELVIKISIFYIASRQQLAILTSYYWLVTHVMQSQLPITQEVEELTVKMAESSGAELHLDVEEDPFANFGMEEWLQLDDTAIDSQLAGPSLNDHQLKSFIQKNKALKKTTSDLSVWYRWCESVGEHRKLKDLSSEDLNRLLYVHHLSS